MSGASRDNKRETLACILMKHEIHSYQSKAVNATVYFLFFLNVFIVIIINDVVITIMTITIIVVVVHHVKNVFFLYIVIKKSCWTVTYSFESGLNFIHVGTVNGEMGLCILETWLFFFFYTLNPSQMKINWRPENDSFLSSYLLLYSFSNHGATLLVRG